MQSAWEKSSSGPDRRMYEITPGGIRMLHESAQALMATDQILNVFLSRYRKFVAPERALDFRSGR